MLGTYKKQGEEISDFKPPASMDEILNAKISPIIDAINNHIEAIYKDFNMAMHKEHMNLIAVEKNISQMVEVLWGLVNKSNARMAALERVLINNGLSIDQLAEEIERIEKELEKAGMKQYDLNDIAKKIGLDINQANQ